MFGLVSMERKHLTKRCHLPRNDEENDKNRKPSMCNQAELNLMSTPEIRIINLWHSFLGEVTAARSKKNFLGRVTGMSCLASRRVVVGRTDVTQSPGERSADSVPTLLTSSGASLEHPSVVISLFGISLERSS